MITSLSQLDPNGTYTYADYLLWQFSERVELIKGKLFPMSPAPSRRHQQIATYLTVKFYSVVNGSPCQMYPAPFDVRLRPLGEGKPETTYTVVQPDLCVICDPEKLDDRGCMGAPDLIVEILSPGNTKKEMQIKFDLYRENGVKEYWIVFPPEELIQVFVLADDGSYRLARNFNTGDLATSGLFPDLQVPLDELFAE